MYSTKCIWFPIAVSDTFFRARRSLFSQFDDRKHYNISTSIYIQFSSAVKCTTIYCRERELTFVQHQNIENSLKYLPAWIYNGEIWFLHFLGLLRPDLTRQRARAVFHDSYSKPRWLRKNRRRIEHIRDTLCFFILCEKLAYLFIVFRQRAQ